MRIGKYIVSVLIILLLFILIVSCMGESKMDYATSGMSKSVSNTSEMHQKSDFEESSQPRETEIGEVKKYERKIIKDATLSANLDKLIDENDDRDRDKLKLLYDDTVKHLQYVCENLGGYIHSYSENIYTNRKEGYIVFKVPSEKFGEFLKIIMETEAITSQSIDAKDITAEYYDIMSRLNNAKNKEARLNEIMTKANTVEDILAVENELSNTRELIERLEGNIRLYDNLVGMSTINLSIYGPYYREEVTAKSFSKNISDTFEQSLKTLINFGKAVIYFFVAISIWIPIIVVAIIILLAIIKSIKS